MGGRAQQLGWGEGNGGGCHGDTAGFRLHDAAGTCDFVDEGPLPDAEDQKDRAAIEGGTPTVMLNMRCWETMRDCDDWHGEEQPYRYHDGTVADPALLAALGTSGSNPVGNFIEAQAGTPRQAAADALVAKLSKCPGTDPEACKRAALPRLRAAIHGADVGAFYTYARVAGSVRGSDCAAEHEKNERDNEAWLARLSRGLCELVAFDGCAGRVGLMCSGKPREVLLELPAK